MARIILLICLREKLAFKIFKEEPLDIFNNKIKKKLAEKTHSKL
jgi:hypothetical protein